MNWLLVVKKRRPPESRSMIVDLCSADTKLARNRHVGSQFGSELTVGNAGSFEVPGDC